MWRKTCLAVGALFLTACAMSPADNADATTTVGAALGSGPYPATMETDAALPHQTIYRPDNLGALRGAKLGLLIWGDCVEKRLVIGR